MSVDLRHLLIDIEDQHHYNSCGGQAASTYLEAVWRKFDGNSKEFSAAFIWQMAKKVGGRSGNDGVTVNELMTALQKYGACLDATFPHTDENLQRDPPAIAIREAKKYKIGKWKRLYGQDQIKQHLDKGVPVIVLMDFGGGHFVCVFGYDSTGFLIVNSWGAGWMNSGTQVIPYDEFNRRLKSAVVVTRLPWQWLKGVSAWFRKML